jgi:hypothetical protein
MIIYKALIRSKMECGAFLFHKLKKNQAQKLEKIQYRVIYGALGYRCSTPINVMLAEAKEIPIFSRFRQLGRNYVFMCYTSSNHPMVQLLEELSTLVDNHGRGGKITTDQRILQRGNSSPSFNPIRELSPGLPTTHTKASSMRPEYRFMREEK